MYKLITVDIWDTLLRRDCHPECIKLATSWYLYYGWSANLKSRFTSGQKLYQSRLQCEKKLANKACTDGMDDEYDLYNVFICWIQDVFADEVPSFLVDELVAYELSVEKSRSYVDPHILSFIDSYDGDKIIFLSDFYMSSDLLLRLLTAKGLDSIISEGIASCDIGLNKRSGNLYRYVHQRYSVLPSEHLHIGDNVWSDVSAARAHGIRAVHYKPPAAHQKRIYIENLFISRNALFEEIRDKCQQNLDTCITSASSKQFRGMQLGVDSSILFIGFALWIGEQIVKEKLDRVYFLTREGEFFYRCFSTLFPDGQFFGHRLPPCEILAVSRLSTFSASLKEISIQEMLRIWNLFKVQSITGLFDTLGISKSRFAGLLRDLDLDLSDIIRDPENNEGLSRLFSSPTFLESARLSSVNSRELLLLYLKSKDVLTQSRIGIVDIGWRGTIQDNLALILPDIHVHGMYLGLRPFINRQPANASKDCFGPNENILQQPSDLFENFSLMEMLCNSSNGSVQGYSLDDSTVIPIRQIDYNEKIIHDEFVGPFQDGVVLATEVWSSYIDKHSISSNELRESSLGVWETLRKAPNRELTNAFLNTPQIDTFGYGDVFLRNGYPTLTTILLAVVSRKRRNQLFDFVRRLQWSAAIAGSDQLGFVHKKLLLYLFYAAREIKRLKLRLQFIVRRYKPVIRCRSAWFR